MMLLAALLERYYMLYFAFSALPLIRVVPSGIIQAQSGERMEISCSTPSTSIVPKWSAKCNTSLPSSIFQDQFGKLIFPAVEPCQSGIYTCHLSNQDGSLSEDVILTVDLSKRKIFITSLFKQF